MNPSKRVRTGESIPVNGDTTTTTTPTGGGTLTMLREFMKLDPSELIRLVIVEDASASTARSDKKESNNSMTAAVVTFSDLCQFHEKLGSSLAQHSHNNKAAADPGDCRISVTNDEETTTNMPSKEEKRGWICSKKCFVCKKRANLLFPCECFIESGLSGDGVIVCESCRERHVYTFCPECQAMLSAGCCDTSYKCKVCEKVTCLSCAEEEGYGGKFCDCNNWYCPGCAAKALDKESCCRCEQFFLCCRQDCERLAKCQGSCHLPLCDNCNVMILDGCGHAAPHHYCGKCHWQCPQCQAVTNK